MSQNTRILIVPPPSSASWRRSRAGPGPGGHPGGVRLRTRRPTGSGGHRHAGGVQRLYELLAQPFLGVAAVREPLPAQPAPGRQDDRPGQGRYRGGAGCSGPAPPGGLPGRPARIGRGRARRPVARGRRRPAGLRPTFWSFPTRPRSSGPRSPARSRPTRTGAGPEQPPVRSGRTGPTSRRSSWPRGIGACTRSCPARRRPGTGSSA